MQAPHIPKIGEHETGEASWYGDPYHGRRAANGEIYDMEKLTAAHRTFAFDTWLRVENLSNDKSVIVRVTDRGPFAHHRIIDLSRAAAREIDMLGPGVAKVRLEVVPAPKQSREQSPSKNRVPVNRAPDRVTTPSDSGANTTVDDRIDGRRYDPVVPPPTDQPYEPSISSSGDPDSGELTTDVPVDVSITGGLARFTLQVGAYRDQDKAFERIEEIKKFKLSVAVTFDERTSLWKVTAGAFKNRQEARGLASTLRKEGVESFVVELPR